VGDACGNSQVIQMFLDALHILPDNPHQQLEWSTSRASEIQASRVANGTAMESSLQMRKISPSRAKGR